METSLESSSEVSILFVQTAIYYLANQMKLIELQNINKVYNLGKENETKVLTDLNLNIWEGDFVAIMGPSGSGKSTLMNIMGLLDNSTSGSYFFRGLDIANFRQKELARLRSDEIGFIFQSFNLLGRTTAQKNVEMPTLYNKRKSNESSQRLLELVGLWDKKDSKPNQLSGGQQQRVAVARALINRPSLILADEPTGNLDTKTGSEILALLINLNNEGHAIVIITHDPKIASLAKRVIHLQDGKIVREEKRLHINYSQHVLALSL